MVRMLNVLFMCLLFSNLNGTGLAQNPETKKIINEGFETIYFKSEALFKCGIKLPRNFNPHSKYNLVIGMHGGGGSVERFVSIWDGAKNFEFIFAVPQGPYSWLIGGKIGYDWALWPSGNKALIERATELAGGYLADLIRFLKTQYNIGEVYMLGFSQGAIFTYLVGITNYTLYDGLICLSGPGLLEPLASRFTGQSSPDWLEEEYIKKANSLRIFIGHGRNDKEAKYELGVKSRDVLLKYGYDVSFRDFNGGHSIDPGILKEVLKWLKR